MAEIFARFIFQNRLDIYFFSPFFMHSYYFFSFLLLQFYKKTSTSIFFLLLGTRFLIWKDSLFLKKRQCYVEGEVKQNTVSE